MRAAGQGTSPGCQERRKGGVVRGIFADAVRDFERWLNKKYAKQLGKRPLTLVIIPSTRDKLLPGVVQGLGDIAVGNITITDARRRATTRASWR